MIQLDIRSRTKNPIAPPTPSVVRNPTPPKNLRLRSHVSCALQHLASCNACWVNDAARRAKSNGGAI